MRYMTGADARPNSVSFQLRMRLQVTAMVTMMMAMNTQAAKRPRRFLVSSALRSKHSVSRETLFLSLSNHDLGWSSIRLKASIRKVSIQDWPQYSSKKCMENAAKESTTAIPSTVNDQCSATRERSL